MSTDDDKIPLTDDRDTFPRICPHCMTVITSRGSHVGSDGYNACVGYGYGERRASDPLGVVAALRLRDRALLALAERVAALDPVVDTSRGGCCDSSNELTCGLCNRTTGEYDDEIGSAGKWADVSENGQPFRHAPDCPHLVAKDLVEGVNRLAERRAAEGVLWLRLAYDIAQCSADAWRPEYDRFAEVPAGGIVPIKLFKAADRYVGYAATGAVYALVLFAALSDS